VALEIIKYRLVVVIHPPIPQKAIFFRRYVLVVINHDDRSEMLFPSEPIQFIAPKR